MNFRHSHFFLVSGGYFSQIHYSNKVKIQFSLFGVYSSSCKDVYCKSINFRSEKKKTKATMLTISTILVITLIWISANELFGNVSASKKYISNCEVNSNKLTLECSDHYSNLEENIRADDHYVYCDQKYKAFITVIKFVNCDFNRRNHHLLKIFRHLRRIDLS